MVLQLSIGVLLLLSGVASLHAQNFTSSVIARDMGGAVSVNARDYDMDGDVDMMVSTWTPGAVYYYEHRPLDSLVRTELYVNGGAGRSMDSGDLDNDGDIDAVFASYSENRLVLFRNGPGETPSQRFTSEFLSESEHAPFTILADDFSGDDQTDLLATNVGNGGESIGLFEQIGGELTAIWSSSISRARDPLGIAVADLDGDGLREILVAVAADDGGVFIMRRSQSGAYSINQEIPNVYLVAVAVADLDNNGQMDIIGCDYATNHVRRWELTPGGWVTRNVSGTLTRPRDVVIADFDADGRLDFAVTGEGSSGEGGGVTWWRQTETGAFTNQSLVAQAGFYGLEVSDFDRDGDLDLLAANFQLEQVFLFKNQMGTPTRIIGQVRSERDDLPISGAFVTVTENGVTAISDETGSYELGMTEGTFTVRVSHSCWDTVYATEVQTFENDTTDVDFELRRPVMELAATSLNLFVQNERETSHDLRVINSGDAELLISAEVQSIAPANGWITVAPLQLTIPPGHEDFLTLSFTPDTSNDGQYDYLGALLLHTNSCPDTSIEVPLSLIVLDVPERRSGILPSVTTLAPAYPNPFNPTVTIPAEIASGETYSMRIYDVLGREADILFEGQLSPGHYGFSWNATRMAAGRYVAVLKSSSGASWKTPLVLIK